MIQLIFNDLTAVQADALLNAYKGAQNPVGGSGTPGSAGGPAVITNAAVCSPAPIPPVVAPVPVTAPVMPAPIPQAAAVPALAAQTAAPVAAAPTYTIAQIAKAGGDLIAKQPAKMPELLSLLSQFGVPSITALKPDQLGPFATAARGIGVAL